MTYKCEKGLNDRHGHSLVYVCWYVTPHKVTQVSLYHISVCLISTVETLHKKYHQLRQANGREMSVCVCVCDVWPVICPWQLFIKAIGSTRCTSVDTEQWLNDHHGDKWIRKEANSPSMCLSLSFTNKEEEEDGTKCWFCIHPQRNHRPLYNRK